MRQATHQQSTAKCTSMQAAMELLIQKTEKIRWNPQDKVARRFKLETVDGLSEAKANSVTCIKVPNQ